MYQFSKGQALTMVQTNQNWDIFVAFNKMAAICPDFKWLGFRILDPIYKLISFQTFEMRMHLDFKISQ